MRAPPVLVLLAALVGGLVVACATMQWPARGALVCVSNTGTIPVRVSARDGQGRELDKGKVWPGEMLQFRWPWIDGEGQLVAEYPNIGRIQSQPFDPWSAERFQWDVGMRNGLYQPRAGRCP